ncbi:hypothetical protein CEB3_c14040 [Peptococcaceae bacterium CEB3]|nr:hypothetical protein CEB3_c14040 [Peptococcaceae bacterium CEB3]
MVFKFDFSASAIFLVRGGISCLQPVISLNGRKYPLVYVSIFCALLTRVALEQTNDLMEAMSDCFQAHDQTTAY